MPDEPPEPNDESDTNVVFPTTSAVVTGKKDVPRMEDALDQVGFEWRGDPQLYEALYNLWSLTAFTEDSVRVLLNGATGTGKELLARGIHRFVGGTPNKFISVNCANLNPETAEATLFGARRGAFTGMTRDLVGFFQLAAEPGSTLFLDEIQELDKEVRTKMHRALFEKTFSRMGEQERVLTFSGHVVSAGSSKLNDMVDHGEFPQDLLSRLYETDEVFISPFDKRPVEHRRAVIEFGFRRWCRGVEHHPGVADALLDVRFPGNVRDLRGFITGLGSYARRDKYLAESNEPSKVTMANFTELRGRPRWSYLDVVRPHEEFSLPSSHAAPPLLSNSVASAIGAVPSNGYPPSPKVVVAPTLDEIEQRHILETLDKTNWNKSQTAALLGIERSTLDRKLKRYGVQRPA